MKPHTVVQMQALRLGKETTLIWRDIFAVELYQYPGLCEKRGWPHESPVRPQSCTPKASSFWKFLANILHTEVRKIRIVQNCK